MSEKKPPAHDIVESHGEDAHGDGTETPVAPPKKKGPLQALIRFEKKIAWVFKQSWLVIKHVRARDAASRQMAWGFILSILGVLITGVWGTSAYLAHRKQIKEERVQLELIEAKIRGELDSKLPLGKLKPDLQSLGLLEFQLKKDPSVKKVKGVYHLAEIEFVAECDTAATCTFIKAHLVQIQNLLVSSFEPQDRDELLSREGKRKLRRIVSDKLNEKLGLWLEHGKVEAIHINHLLVN